MSNNWPSPVSLYRASRAYDLPLSSIYSHFLGVPVSPRICGTKLCPSSTTPWGSFASVSSANVVKKSLKSIKSAFDLPAGVTPGQFTIKGTRLPPSLSVPLTPTIFRPSTVACDIPTRAVPLSPLNSTTVFSRRC